MVRKVKAKTGTLDMNNLKDISPVIRYWLQLLGEGKEVKDCFKGLKKKGQVLEQISKMIMDEHDFIKRLRYLRKMVIAVLGRVDNSIFKEAGTFNRAIEIENSVNSHTAIGYWETMKLMQVFIIMAYMDAGKEEELPLYGDLESNFKPDGLIIKFCKEKI